MLLSFFSRPQVHSSQLNVSAFSDKDPNKRDRAVLEAEKIEWGSIEFKFEVFDVKINMFYLLRNIAVSSDLNIKFFVGFKYFDQNTGRRVVKV